MKNQKLSNRIRENIILALKNLQLQGDFNETRLWNTDFNKLDDKTLVTLRDNELVHIMEFDDKEYVNFLQDNLYDENVYSYWNIKK